MKITSLIAILIFSMSMGAIVKMQQDKIDHYKYCAAIQGDVNCDGKVNVQDLSMVSANWGGEK